MRAVERHRITEDDTSTAQRVGQRDVGRDATGLESIRFGEHHVERDDSRTEIAHAGDQVANDIASPRPLADRGETALVDVDDGDAIAG